MNCVNFKFLVQELIRVFPHSLNKDTAFPSSVCKSWSMCLKKIIENAFIPFLKANSLRTQQLVLSDSVVIL